MTYQPWWTEGDPEQDQAYPQGKSDRPWWLLPEQPPTLDVLLSELEDHKIEETEE